MDELIDILDSKGDFTGKTAMKSDAHRNGWFHPTVHVWLYTEDGKILIQQRAKNKDTYPLLWDVSVAGHIGAGEPVGVSAVREVQEEIGLEISTEALEKIGIFKSVHEHSNELIDCEFQHIFLCELKVSLQNLKKQQGEVEALALIPLLKFSQETWGLANLKKYAPHGEAYYRAIIEEIKKRSTFFL